jgi:hypothetical protein
MDRGGGQSSKYNVHGRSILTKSRQEAYLLRTRRNKMPYKHIAAQLRKTELACRLHYHQMSYGSNRRKRGASVSSLNSSPSYTPGSSVQDLSPQHTPYNVTPMTSPSTSPRSAPSQMLDNLSSPPLYQGPQLPLLPKPILSEGRPVLPSPSKWSNSLQLNTEIKLPSASELLRSPPIDPSRLRDLYEAHRKNFWAQIANQYSPNSQISASELEAAFLARHGGDGARNQPPTPEPSPQNGSDATFCAPMVKMEPYRFSGFTPMSSGRGLGSPPYSANKCTVNALLNGPSHAGA